jgi:hypothetical protein
MLGSSCCVFTVVSGFCCWGGPFFVRVFIVPGFCCAYVVPV